MSAQTQTMGKQETERNCKESAAAAALVDVASGFKQQQQPQNNHHHQREASDSPTSSTTGGGTNNNKGALPTNSASRKLWDREQAAPMSDHGITGRFPPLESPQQQQQHGFTTAAHASSLAAAAVAAGANWPTETHHHHPHHHSQQRGRMDPAGFLGANVDTAHTANATTTTATTTTSSNQVFVSSSAAAPASNASAVNMSMSSIGFGVDPSCSLSPGEGDATEAAYRAVRDAMERSAVRMPIAPTHRQNLSIHVKLGVPARPSSLGGSNEQPMRVDVERLAPLLPRSVPLQPIEVTVGGLLIDHKEMGASTRGAAESVEHHPTICTAVACVTLQQITTVSDAEAALASSNNKQGMSAMDAHHHSVVAESPWAHLGPSSSISGGGGGGGGGNGAALMAMAVQRRSPEGIHQQQLLAQQPPRQVNVHRSNSMEVLALISGEIRERHLNSQRSMAAGGGNANGSSAPATAAMNLENGSHHQHHHQHHNNEVSSLASDGSNKNNPNNAAYSYKKLAPGMTPKNNKRLFVKHTYRDYSHEEPLPEEQYLVRSQDAPHRTPNAAFPLKLHETLTQIEQDGYGHIIGWLPHGRSFKIFQQQEFISIVLPRYFVMTKKSSFLRQLNLYGFNRISVGPDGGSYYHEKFLRGLKFLCRRMTRQKVNGNGIRAAGNPDEEPNLTRLPTCPPSAHGAASCNSSVTHNENDSHADNNSHPSPPEGKDSAMAMDESSTASHGSASGAAGETGNGRGQLKRSQSSGGGGGGGSSVQVSFPLKLQRLLDKMEAEENTGIISWLPHGRAFLVHDVDKFVLEIMTQYFNQTKYSSFQRQLHMYNFQRITFGRDKGAYHHPSFQRGRPNLCLSMVRTRVNGKGCRRPGDPDAEPSFYEEEYVPPIPKGSVIEIPTDASGVGGNDEDTDAARGAADHTTEV